MAPQQASVRRHPRQPNDVANEALSPRFFKVIRHSAIQEKKLTLPLKFAMEYRNELSGIVKLTVPDGRVWKLKVEIDGLNIRLDNGFHEFASYYSLKDGHMLYFEYKGMSNNFNLHIYDMSSCEISYPPHVIHVCDSPPHPNTTEEKKKKKTVSTNRKYKSDCGIPSPRQFESENPHFEIKLTYTNLRHRILYVPTKFYKQHRAKVQPGCIKFVLGDGRKWHVSLKEKKFEDRKCGRLVFGGGWTTFREANNIKGGDVCIFELIKENAFKVYLFTAV